MSDERAVTPGDDPLTRTAEAVGGALGSAVKTVSETAQEAASTAASVASSAVSTAKSAGSATAAAVTGAVEKTAAAGRAATSHCGAGRHERQEDGEGRVANGRQKGKEGRQDGFENRREGPQSRQARQGESAETGQSEEEGPEGHEIKALRPRPKRKRRRRPPASGAEPLQQPTGFARKRAGPRHRRGPAVVFAAAGRNSSAPAVGRRTRARHTRRQVNPVEQELERRRAAARGR